MKKATLYRMVMHDHICPFGTKSKYLLRKEGFEVKDHHLTTKEETLSFKDEHSVETTPQTFIGGQRVGGYDDLRIYFKKSPSPKKGATSYVPVFALFGISLLTAVAVAWSQEHLAHWALVLRYFFGFSMCALALQKLRDPFSFSNSFLNYDLLAQRYVPYSYVYSVLELLVGVSMLAQTIPRIAGIVSLFIGLEGGASVFKAVYLDHRELKCACMGGDSNVPLGAISMTENLMMVGMGVMILSQL